MDGLVQLDGRADVRAADDADFADELLRVGTVVVRRVVVVVAPGERERPRYAVRRVDGDPVLEPLPRRERERADSRAVLGAPLGALPATGRDPRREPGSVDGERDVPVPRGRVDVPDRRLRSVGCPRLVPLRRRAYGRAVDAAERAGERLR